MGEWDDGGVSKQDGSGRQVSAAPVDDLTATVLHVDMDAFFASVELLDHPELRGKPVIVGHRSLRSVVTAATYEARKYGVNSAMPMAVALRRCPQAIVLEPHFERYTHWSERRHGPPRRRHARGSRRSASTRRSSTSPARSGCSARPGRSAPRCASGSRRRPACTARSGAAATKFVAKLASSRAKPNGLLVVPEAETLDFLHPQPVSALWGVGGKSEEVLQRLGLRTVGDLAAHPARHPAARDRRRRRRPACTSSPGAAIRARSSPGREEKSVGHETTFETDRTDAVQLHRELLRLSDAVGVRLRRAGVAARTVVLKLRFEDFTTITRSRTLAEPTDLGRRLYEESRSLYDAANPSGRPVRLIGVRGEQLVGAVASLGLWDDDEQWRDAETAVDAVSTKFGRGRREARGAAEGDAAAPVSGTGDD